MLNFLCDYTRGCHPALLSRLVETNLQQTPGYGDDGYTKRAKELILKSCGLEHGQVYFLVGGTQTNAAVIDGVLSRVHGVLCADSGHINVHESGAIEASGHKVLTLPSHDGKVLASELENYLSSFYRDETYEHMVQPGMLYISQPTELGTLYSLSELKALKAVCTAYDLPLYIDGARLGYALGAPNNDARLEDIARIADVFYIGGTKVGALFGEAVVCKDPALLPHFFTLIKQHGALLAKGRLLGVQFETLFTDDLYFKIGVQAVALALKLKEAFKARGVACFVDSPTNQQFFVLPNQVIKHLQEKAAFELWGPLGTEKTPVRFVTDWATSAEDIEALIRAYDEAAS